MFKTKNRNKNSPYYKTTTTKIHSTKIHILFFANPCQNDNICAMILEQCEIFIAQFPQLQR